MAINVQRDNKFGSYIMFGSGVRNALISGSYRAVELPPLNRYLARKLVQRSNLWPRALSRQLTPGVFEALLDSMERIRTKDHTSELHSLMRPSYAVSRFIKKNNHH